VIVLPGQIRSCLAIRHSGEFATESPAGAGAASPDPWQFPQSTPELLTTRSRGVDVNRHEPADEPGLRRGG